MPCPHFLQITTLLLVLAHMLSQISRVKALKIFVAKAGSITSRLAKWSILLSQFYIVYVPKKAVKGQALADFFLAAHPLPPDSNLNDYLPDEPVFHIETFPGHPIDRWEIYFDGATRTNSNEELTSGVGKLFITPEGHMIPHSFSLTESCSNNVAEYQALIMGMEMAHEISIDPLEVCGDSKLIVNQMNGKYEVKKPNFLLYHKKDGSSPRRYFNIEHIPFLAPEQMH